ncbi:MAG: 3'-to-5' exoribonuclease RNase R [Cytophagales bacterium]|nr:MAG: 3'-to-5' exoribonuclease RNase R [Cytophagales bacterium]
MFTKAGDGHNLLIMSKKKFKEKKSRKEKEQKSSFYKSVVKLLNEAPGKAFDFKQIARKTGAKNKFAVNEVSDVLESLLDEGTIRQLSNGSFTTAQKSKTLTGIIDHVNPRFAYAVTGTEGVKDIYIHTRDLNGAIHGDKVAVEVLHKKSNGHTEGRVTEILERTRNRFVGRVELSKNYAFIIPDFKKIHTDFFVYPENIRGAKHNDKVLFEVTRWPEGDKNPEAKIIEILGKAGENEAEIHSIMAEFNLPFCFPDNVLRESEKISEEILKEEINKRRDFRDVLTFTIDPEDAKDFDDAISFKKLENGNYEIGVHIADVTHYVKSGTVLDDDAYDRATSVYLVDRTVPMLPEKLSNGLCSLRPNEDKFTFAAVFEMDNRARIINEWFGRTVIHSDHRFTYEQAQEVIETGSGKFAGEMKTLNSLALLLRKERFAKGAVNFETAEVKFKLDAKGKPLAVIPKIRKDAHKLIEDFMLLANRAVATYIYKMKKSEGKNTFVYRIHESPDPEKVRDFSLFAKQFGHKINTEDHNISKSLNKLMDEIEGKPEQNVLQSLAVRAMAKAKYTTDPKGHFGLAFDHYTHFTSPIRRYPDMMVHRLLQHYLDGGKSVDKSEYEEKCIHSSEREKRAADAERASIKYKQVEFMSLADDKMYEGIITGVTDFGIFIEIVETKCEGMVRLADMKDDFYEYDERNYRVIGRRRNKIYRLGDAVQVRIKKTDIDRRTIDLTFEQQEEW